MTTALGAVPRIIMGLLGRLLGRSSGIMNEQGLEKVIIGQDYFGKLGEEFFDAPTEQPKKTAQGPTANRRQNLPAAKASSSGLKAKSPTKPVAPENEISKSGKRISLERIPSSDVLGDILPVLVNLTKVGEELLPLLKTLTRQEEDFHHTTQPGADRKKVPSQALASSDQTREKTALKKTILIKGNEASSPSSVSSNARVKGSEPRISASMERSEGSPTSTTASQATPRTPTNSLSTESDPQKKALQRRSTQEEAAFSSFKRLCAAHGFLKRPAGIGEQDVCDGINDEATLRYVCSYHCGQLSPLCLCLSNVVVRRFFYARKRDVSDAHRQFKEAWDAREVNHLCEFYEEIDIHDLEETRNLVRDQLDAPFSIGSLTNR